MNHDLADLLGHHTWATNTLISFCTSVPNAVLMAKVPGTYGSIVETLNHLINADLSYLFRISDIWPDRLWATGENVPLPLVAERAAILAAAWETYRSHGIDVDATGEARGDHNVMLAVPHGVFITQAIHHANEHRAQICTILGTCGIATPNLSGWEYGIVTDRSRP